MENYTNPNTQTPINPTAPLNPSQVNVGVSAPMGTSTSVNTSTVPTTPPPMNMDPMGSDSGSAVPPMNPNQVASAPKKSKMMSLILGIVLLVILGVGAWMYFGGSATTEDDTNNATPTPFITPEISVTPMIIVTPPVVTGSGSEIPTDMTITLPAF